MTLCTTDLDAWLLYRFPQPIAGPVSDVVMPLEPLNRALRSNKGQISLLLESKEVIIRTFIGQTPIDHRCELKPVEEWPTLPPITALPVPITADAIKAIREAMDFASDDSSRIVLNSVCLDGSHKDAHYVVGTNGRALYSANSFKFALKEPVSIPTHKFWMWNGLPVENCALTVQPHSDKNQEGWLKFQFTDWTFITKEQVGNYPNWRQVIPQDFNINLEFNEEAVAVVQTSTITPAVVAREKAQAVKKNGLLEIVEAKETLNDIGGLDCLKQWLQQRRLAFSDKAAAYRLPTPKGLLIIGIPGTGKSLTAKATAQVFGVPLLKLDAGRIFGGLVGQSEANLRAVIQTTEAIAPCCLWIDELEKAFSGTKAGNSDGGTSARVFGSLINWLQEKTKPVFVVATANDISQLPPELLRKGRFDEIFFVDLPNHQERAAIWKLVVDRYGRESSDYDIDQLSRITEGFTGSEIEAVFVESMFVAFGLSREPSDLDIAAVTGEMKPLSQTMAESIKQLKQWSIGRARSATSPVSLSSTRKLAV